MKRCEPGIGEAGLRQACADCESHWNASKTSGPSYSQGPLPWALPKKTKANMTGGTLLCLTNTHTYIQNFGFDWSVTLYLQATMPQGHKADRCSFETVSTSRPLNPSLLMHIPLTLNIGHKTSCFIFLSHFYPPLVLWITRISTSPYTLETTFLSREKKSETQATSQQFDSRTNHTLILWG